MLAAYDEAGGTLRGFDLATCWEVPAGCGLSSSAAFEVMVGAVLEGCSAPGPSQACQRRRRADAAEGGDGFVPLNPVALALAGFRRAALLASPAALRTSWPVPAAARCCSILRRRCPR